MNKRSTLYKSLSVELGDTMIQRHSNPCCQRILTYHSRITFENRRDTSNLKKDYC